MSAAAATTTADEESIAADEGASGRKAADRGQGGEGRSVYGPRSNVSATLARRSPFHRLRHASRLRVMSSRVSPKPPIAAGEFTKDGAHPMPPIAAGEFTKDGAHPTATHCDF